MNHTQYSLIDEQAICDYIKEHSGILVQNHQRIYLKEIIVETCRHFNLSSTNDLLNNIQQTTHSQAFNFLINSITVNESYFFRDTEQLAFLKAYWLPQIIQQKNANSLKQISIWSAGCSGGQEIYSMAMLLDELLTDDSWQQRLIGTDIDEKILKQAEQGLFNQWSLRSTPVDYINRYFHSLSDNMYELKSHIRQKVNFIKHNLKSFSGLDSMITNQKFDLILCRNVLIYFELETAQTIIQHFVNHLNVDGVLLLGSSDPLVTTPAALLKKSHDGVFYFQCIDLASVIKPIKYSTPPVLPILKSSPVIKPNNYYKEHKIHKDNVKITLSVKQHMQSGHWQKALALIEQESQNDYIKEKIICLTNLGQHHKAITVCNNAISQKNTDTGLYFLKGLIHNDNNQMPEAEQCYKKAIFLDLQFVEAHYHLGLLYLSKMKKGPSQKSLKNALKYAQAKPGNSALFHMPNITYEQFTVKLIQEIKRFT